MRIYRRLTFRRNVNWIIDFMLGKQTVCSIRFNRHDPSRTAKTRPHESK